MGEKKFGGYFGPLWYRYRIDINKNSYCARNFSLGGLLEKNICEVKILRKGNHLEYGKFM